MESAVVSVVVKPEPLQKRFPKNGQMVRVEGKKGLFVVKHVDRRLRACDLMQRVWKREVLDRGVSFALIRPVSPHASRVIRQFLGASLLKGGPGQDLPLH